MIQPSGIYLVNKPTGMTSNDLIQKIKRKLGVKKIGHAGTLDPLANGLMVVLVNQATKISDYILTANKGYIVKMKFFVDTDTKDITGNVVNEETPRKLSKKEFEKVISKYNGFMYDQYPPIYSAIKVNGKKLYEYARKGEAEKVEIKPRPVTINSTKLVEWDAKNNTATLAVDCSKGTYIRSLVFDIAQEMGTIATVEELQRTQSGAFKLENAKNWEDLEESDLISMYDSLLSNDQPLIEYHYEYDIRHGKSINLVNTSYPVVFIINDQKTVVAIYKRVAPDLYACQRGLWEVDKSIPRTEAEKEGYEHVFNN